MLINKAINFNPKIWLILPFHINIVFIGWFLQFIFGVAYWILPRYPSYEKSKLPLTAYFFINTYLCLFFIKTVLLFLDFGKEATNKLQLFSLFIIILGVISFARHIYKRISYNFFPSEIK
ncbi:MAG: hypothetical protein U0457_05855 [Candidatus Sericytochromatia bacterium]